MILSRLFKNIEFKLLSGSVNVEVLTLEDN